MKKKEDFINVHPGEMLQDVLNEISISAYKLSKATSIPTSNLSEILNGKRKITPELSVRLGRFFEQSPSFWLNLQNSYELRQIEHDRKKELDSILPYAKIG